MAVKWKAQTTGEIEVNLTRADIVKLAIQKWKEATKAQFGIGGNASDHLPNIDARTEEGTSVLWHNAGHDEPELTGATVKITIVKRDGSPEDEAA